MTNNSPGKTFDLITNNRQYKHLLLNFVLNYSQAKTKFHLSGMTCIANGKSPLNFKEAMRIQPWAAKGCKALFNNLCLTW